MLVSIFFSVRSATLFLTLESITSLSDIRNDFAREIAVKSEQVPGAENASLTNSAGNC